MRLENDKTNRLTIQALPEGFSQENGRVDSQAQAKNPNSTLFLFGSWLAWFGFLIHQESTSTEMGFLVIIKLDKWNEKTDVKSINPYIGEAYYGMTQKGNTLRVKFERTNDEVRNERWNARHSHFTRNAIPFVFMLHLPMAMMVTMVSFYLRVLVRHSWLISQALPPPRILPLPFWIEFLTYEERESLQILKFYS